MPRQLYPVYDYWHTSPEFFLMRLGMLLEPEYPAVEYVPGHTLCEGREAWLRFHLQPQSRVEMVRRHIHRLLEVLRQGLATPEHAAWVKRLAAKKAKPRRRKKGEQGT